MAEINENKNDDGTKDPDSAPSHRWLGSVWTPEEIT